LSDSDSNTVEDLDPDEVAVDGIDVVLDQDGEGEAEAVEDKNAAPAEAGEQLNLAAWADSSYFGETAGLGDTI